MSNVPAGEGASPGVQRALVAGALLGSLGSLAFGLFHWFFILPVLSVIVIGLVVWGPVFGALVGWAYHLVVVTGALARRRHGPLLFGLVLALSLVPYEAVGLAFGPLSDRTTFAERLPLLPIALAGVPVPLLAAWRWRLSKKAAAVWAFAVFALNFELGGSIAFFGGRGAMLGLFVVLAVLYVAMGPALAIVHGWLGRWRDPAVARDSGP